jgi:tetratricopeptide (TPR) repeat protein
MEALRKAEEAKRKIQTQGADSSSDFSRAAASPPDIAPVPVLTASPEPELMHDELDSEVDADLFVDSFLRSAKTASAAATPPFVDGRKSGRASVEELQSYLETTPDPEEAAAALRNEVPAKHSADIQQRAARAVFAAKQKPAPSHATRNILLTILILLVPIGAAVLWYLANFGSSSSMVVDPALLGATNGRSLSDELLAQSESQPAAQNPAPAEITPMQEQIAATAPTNEVTAASPASAAQQSRVSATNPPQPEIAAETAPAVQPQAVPAQEPITAAATPVAAQSTAPALTETLTANESADSGIVLEVSHSAATNKNNPQLLVAYASLRAGDLASASTQYRQVLEQFPNNRDALLGNAAIAMRQGNLMQARELYSRLMQLNPKDPLARTGLLQTVEDVDQLQYEQELQRLIQQYPNVAPLSFALGNIYAAQRRWNEAQSAYFDAFLFARQSNEGAINPDYAYNLAVSLEQLNQPEAALDYYRQAQTLAGAVSPGFDRQELSRRISFLEQNSP